MPEKSGVRIFFVPVTAGPYLSEKFKHMNTSFWKFLCLSLILIAFSCKEKTHEHPDHDATARDVTDVSGNQALYNEVMKIHDEVMPRMDDIHRTKQALRQKLEKASAADKPAIEATIARLDSAGEGMMVWMRQFRPLPDSLGEEKAREYLENEMEKVKKVREDILQALEQAKKE